MPFTTSPTTVEILMTAVYGTTATIIGIVTVHQGRRAWMIWHAYHHRQEGEAADLELGHPISLPASIEDPEGPIRVPSHTPIENQEQAVVAASPVSVEDGASTAVAPHTLSAPLPSQTSLSIQSPTEVMADDANDANLPPSQGHEAGSDDTPAPMNSVGAPNIDAGPDQHIDGNTAIP
ncbi:hypothetical protein OEA41_003854 [Lepraria neglecta]|uniref:Uncharacterized protein n=1 Tax=Lepraria neglecta TaxID=209136 RepID=A0AAD9Z534_9LECA|nr:hypothetical protein OEA41_003854 [Lepraria neglecta]